MIECLTAPIALLCPRRDLRRRYCAERIGVARAGVGLGGLGERDREPPGSFARAAGAAFAGRLVVCRGRGPPRRQMPRRREDAHVGADLGHDHLGGAPLHAGDRAEQLNRRRERADLLGDRSREQADLLIEEVDVGEDRADNDPDSMSRWLSSKSLAPRPMSSFRCRSSRDRREADRRRGRRATRRRQAHVFHSEARSADAGTARQPAANLARPGRVSLLRPR